MSPPGSAQSKEGFLMHWTKKSLIWGHSAKKAEAGSCVGPSAPCCSQRYPMVPPSPAPTPWAVPSELIASSRQWSYLMSMMTDGVCAMAPIMLQTHITQRNVKKASSQPGLGHLPGTTVAFSAGTEVRHEQPLRFCGGAQGFRGSRNRGPHHLPSVMRACQQQLWVL